MASRRVSSDPSPDLSASPPIEPQAYARWRAGFLGATTEDIEQRIILELASVEEGMRVLDVGCGDGALTRKLHARGGEAVGIDSNAAMIAAAADIGGGYFLVANGERLPFADGTFDLVVAITVLCVSERRDILLSEMARVLRPGGRLVIGELGAWSWWAMLRRIRGWFGNTLWRKAHFFTPRELEKHIRHAGLEVAKMRYGVYYPPSPTVARLCAGADRFTAQVLGPFGAAFLSVEAKKPPISSRK